MRRQSGLTMLEVLIVLAIVMVLTALAYPGYASYITRTRRIEGQIALIEAMQQQERYYMRNNTYAAFGPQASGQAARLFKWWSGPSAQQSAYQIEGAACPGQVLADCIELRATPGTGWVDGKFRDPECAVMTLDSAGRHGASGTGARCWP